MCADILVQSQHRSRFEQATISTTAHPSSVGPYVTELYRTVRFLLIKLPFSQGAIILGQASNVSSRLNRFSVPIKSLRTKPSID